jgi:hypothetical protein
MTRRLARRMALVTMGWIAACGAAGEDGIGGISQAISPVDLLGGEDVLALDPALRVGVGGIDEGGVTYRSLRLALRGGGVIEGTLLGEGLADAIGDSVRGRRDARLAGQPSPLLELYLSGEGGVPLFVVAAVLTPLPDGTGAAIRAFHPRLVGECDLAELRARLVELGDERQRLLGDILALGAQIAGAELAGDAPLVAYLTGLLDERIAELAVVEVAIDALMVKVSLCLGEDF